MSIFDNAVAALRGVGTGASAGMLRYPVAAGIAALDKATGGQRPIGEMYADALAAQRSIDAEDQRNTPLARLAGEIGGGLVTAVATGGGSIPAQIGRTTALGALSGFSQNEGLENTARDVALGGTIGAVSGVAGAGLQKGQELFVKSQLKRHIEGTLEGAALERKAALDALGPTLRSLNPKNSKQEMTMVSSMASGKPRQLGGYNPTPEEVALARTVTTNRAKIAGANKALNKLETADGSTIMQMAAGPGGKNPGKLMGGASRETVRLIDLAKGTAGNIGAGGAAGAGAAMLMGQDPLAGAIGGASGLVGLKILAAPTVAKGAAGLAAKYVPLSTGNVAAQGATLGVTPLATGRVTQAPQETFELEDFDSMFEPVEPQQPQQPQSGPMSGGATQQQLSVGGAPQLAQPAAPQSEFDALFEPIVTKPTAKTGVISKAEQRALDTDRRLILETELARTTSEVDRAALLRELARLK